MEEQTNTTILSFITGRFPQAQLTDTRDIFSLGFINSLFAMELVMFIEKEFAVTIPNDELRIDNFRTVSAMTDLVQRRLSAAAAA